MKDPGVIPIKRRVASDDDAERVAVEQSEGDTGRGRPAPAALGDGDGGVEDSTPISRRALLAGAAGATLASVGAGRVAGAVGEAETKPAVEVQQATAQGGVDSTKSIGRPISELGSRSPYESPRRHLRTTSSGTPHEDLHGIITPSDLHYERHHGGVPDIDPSTYSLLIHGMVDRPMVFTLDDLKRFPSVTSTYFLECSGNFPTRAGEDTRPAQVAPLTSTSEWTGVPLALLFEEVGVHADASWFLAEGQDAAVLTRSIPVEKAWDDSMIAYGQNGEAIRPEQGYPARLLNPGWEGNTSVKWLRRIELSDRPFMTREETSRYTEPIGDGKYRQFSFIMDSRSLITSPGYPETVTPGWIEIRGIAWSGRGRIDQVDVSLDDGQTWVQADLQEPVLSKAFTRFRYLWEWDGQETAIWSRATDETGYVQPTAAEFIAARTARSAYHHNPTTGWRIRSDGTVVYRTQEWA